jgi:hypothetical protein
MDLTDALTIMIFAALGIYLFRLIPFFTPLAVLFISRYRVRLKQLTMLETAAESCHSDLSGSSLTSHFGKGGLRGIFRNKILSPKSPLPPLSQRRESEGFRSSRNDSNGESNISSAKSGKHASTSQIAISAILSLLLIFTLMKGTLFGGLITTNLFHRDSVIVGSKYPEKAVKFLKESGIRGNMFNPLDWGGYLMWYLYPDYKVFTDGRGLREDVVVQASKIMAAVKNDVRGMPEWKAHLEHYNVSMIVTYSVEHFSGRLLPLIPALLNNPEWNLIYVDELSLVFARETPENSTSISKFSMQKEWVWHEVISEAQIKSRGFFSDNVRVTFLITMGDAFLSLKDYQRAMDAYARAWKIAPDNRMVGSRLQFLYSILR